MNIADSVKFCLSKYVTFEGRASRSEYWWFLLAVFLVTLVLSFIMPFLGGLVYLGLILPMIAAAARRLHDIGKSAWFLLVGLIPLVGGLILLYFHVLPGEAGANQFGDAPV
jgi:uncharacterized membrane protein YhaH (DUF805 family)